MMGRDFRSTPELSRLFNEAETKAFYFAVWSAGGALMKSSGNAPAGLPTPERIGNDTAKTEYADPEVALFVDGHQGHILASTKPLKAKLTRIEDFAHARQLQVDELLGYVRGAILGTAAIDNFVRETAVFQQLSALQFISTDDNLALEYATPKGNVPTADHIPTTLAYLLDYKPRGIVQAHVGF